MAMHGTDHYDAVKKKVLSHEKEMKVPKSNFTNIREQMEGGSEHIQHPLVQQSTETVRLFQSGIKTPSKQTNITSKLPQVHVTPHKDASYKSPEHRKLFRKRIAKQKEWKSQIRTENRA